MSESIDNILREHISREVAEVLPSEVSKQIEAVKPLPIWMTEMQVAEYLQLRNKEGGVTADSIRKWTNRPETEHPLPCGNAGEKRLYHREDVDRWVREEAVYQRTRRAEQAREREQRKHGHLQAVGER